MERAQAQALRESDIIPNEPTTIILSKMGWVRAAKGHDIEGTSLSYKAGDEFKMASYGRSNQQAVFFDSTGRTYSVMAHTLPSARGQGEPLTGRMNPPPGATFEAVILDDPDQFLLLAQDAGHGFICQVKDLYCKNRNGKAVLKLVKQSGLVRPSLIQDKEKDQIAVITNTGHFLIFPVTDLPYIQRGKGNKIIQISPNKVAAREEFVTLMRTFSPDCQLKLISGKQSLILKPTDWAHYKGERGRRGHKLPRGFQRVDQIEQVLNR